MSAKRKLKPSEVRELVEREAQYKAAKKQLEAAGQLRAELRARLRPCFDLDEPLQAGGYEVRVKAVRTGPSFRIGEFLKTHKLTKVMAPFYKEGGEREDWRIDQLPQRRLRAVA